MLSDIICIVITTIAKKTTQEKIRMEMRLHAYTCYVRTMRLYVIFSPAPFSKHHCHVSFPLHSYKF